MGESGNDYIKWFREGINPNSKIKKYPKKTNPIKTSSPEYLLNKFCGVCGELKPNNKTYFHHNNWQIYRTCVDCDLKEDNVFCIVCGKVKSVKSRLCVSCGVNKKAFGYHVSIQMPMHVILKMRAYKEASVSTGEVGSKICNKCGFILPNHPQYFLESSSNCYKCRVVKKTKVDGKIKELSKLYKKFCAVCGKLKINSSQRFYSTNGKITPVCLECNQSGDYLFCCICGLPMSGRDKYCLSCQKNKNMNGFFLSKQMPIDVVKQIRGYSDKVRDTCPVKSQICSECGFILPLDTFYYQKDNREDNKSNYRSSCKKCRTGQFRKIIPPKTKKERNLYQRKQRRLPAQFEPWGEKLFADETCEGKDGKLKAKCKYCDRWFYPTMSAVEARYRASIGQMHYSENGLYCSSGCKKACPTFQRAWSEKEYKTGTSRESNALLRKLVLNRDKHQCTKCGAKGKKVELHCHHVIPATQNPMLSNDPDSCITLCKDCHKEIHRMAGCTYYELRCA